ncbi:cupin domain-containing protein [Thiohalocapsa sp.]|jgi:cupin 2 domain-containing protein|uniref:cupin domain-containing protein n=1 Tax=Thiohalocapsa sp. TaxID=2497641 RepID=UPI0025CFE471|nr:cupin domain-containing protein [Thiohalocapsa sp.]
MPQQPTNLFAGLPVLDSGEDFITLIDQGNVQIERIVSSPRPESNRYDQDHDEWVLLLSGQATLELDGKPVQLNTGDHLLIPAHCPHRVLATSDKPRCLWLAVHLRECPTASAAA